MKVFDFNIHLPDLANDDVNSRVHTEMIASHQNLILRAERDYPLDKIDGGNFMIFNPIFYREEDQFNKYMNDKLYYSSYTLLIDFRDPNVYEDIEFGIKAGINCIKFHSYHQQIAKKNYPKIIEICKFAEERNLIICLDASYGTSNMIKYDIIDFICSVANEIHNTPLIALHSGGLKCLEIMLLALDKKNVWVEMSASLPIYMDSSIETDLAFMYKKIDPKKILWATDAPYFPFEMMMDTTEKFLSKHGFSESFKEDVFFNNAMNILNNRP